MIVGLLGTDFSSNNRGCGALGYAAVEIFNSACREQTDTLEIYAFLYRIDPMPQISDENITMHYIVIQPKKLSFWKNAAKILKGCDSVWDFTGGDSFSDIYGMKRFCLNSALKQLAIWSKTKFVMAPQTIGPFENKVALAWAKRILKKSSLSFVRDSISEAYVKNTFGVSPLVTTDVAFALPFEKMPPRADGKVHVGVNPSGLLWDGTKDFCVAKHIVLDYKAYVKGVLDYLCSDDRYAVFLIPHVFSKDITSGENDLKACYEIKESFQSIEILCGFETPMEAKRMISSMDVFIGARMHATIAAFSAGVATIPVSYSRKFEGLYQDLGYPYVIGAACMDTKEAVETTIEWIRNKDALSKKVRDAAERIKERQEVLTEALRQCHKG